MRTVAIRARGGVFVARLARQAVDAGAVAFALLPVTSRAIDRRNRAVVIGMPGGHVRMAYDAGVGIVNGGRQDGGIHKQRLGRAGGIGYHQRFVGMAIQAVAVGKPRPRRPLPEEAECGDD